MGSGAPRERGLGSGAPAVTRVHPAELPCPSKTIRDCCFRLFQPPFTVPHWAAQVRISNDWPAAIAWYFTQKASSIARRAGGSFGWRHRLYAPGPPLYAAYVA